MKSRRFRLGPATTLAIAAGIVIAYVKWPDYAREAEAKRGLDATRAEIARRGPKKFELPRDLDSLWQKREKLGLSAAQEKSLAILRAQETRATANLMRETDAAATDFSLWMKQHQSGATLADIQSRAALYSAKSGELARVRRDFYDRALQLLTPAQGKKLF